MASGSHQPRDTQPAGVDPASGAESTALAEFATSDQASLLIRSAFAFAALCHAGQRRGSDEAAFIEHPLEVAGLLRVAGCSDVVIAAGLLHDLLDDARVSTSELTMRFGVDVANLVQAVSENASIPTYRQRKQLLCEQVRKAGGEAALVFAADTIAKVRELPDRFRRDQARLGAAGSGQRTRDRVERSHQLRLAHYHESLRMLEHVAPEHPLVKLLASELDNFRLAIHSAMTREGM